MEDYQKAKKEALRLMNIADHVLTMTYPLVQDPKLLKMVLKNTYLAMQNTMAALLQYERLYKRVPPFTENFNSMLQLLRPVLQRYKISEGYISFLTEIQETSIKQQESAIEFVRKDKFVFASKDYDLNAISKKEIKDFIAKGKLFMQETIGVIEENERRIGKR